MIRNFDKPKNKVMDFCSAYTETNEKLKKKADALVKDFVKNHNHEDVKEIMFSDSSSITSLEESEIPESSEESDKHGFGSSLKVIGKTKTDLRLGKTLVAKTNKKLTYN